MKFLNIITMTLLISFTSQVFPTRLLAEDKQCFDDSVAANIAVELTYCKENLPKLRSKFDLTLLETISLKQLNENNEIHIKELNKDKTVLLNLSNEYKELLINTNKELVECKEDSPSRLTWFGTGVVSTIIIGIVTLFAIK